MRSRRENVKKVPVTKINQNIFLRGDRVGQNKSPLSVSHTVDTPLRDNLAKLRVTKTTFNFTRGKCYLPKFTQKKKQFSGRRPGLIQNQKKKINLVVLFVCLFVNKKVHTCMVRKNHKNIQFWIILENFFEKFCQSWVQQSFLTFCSTTSL